MKKTFLLFIIFLSLVMVGQTPDETVEALEKDNPEIKSKKPKPSKKNVVTSENSNPTATNEAEPISKTASYADHLKTGISLIAKKEYDNAVINLSSAIEIDPLLSNAYFYRGVAKFHLKDIKNALEDLNKSIKIDAKNNLAYNYKGRCWAELGFNSEALRELGIALTIDPMNAESYYFRAIVKDKMKDMKGALADLNKALQIEETNGDYYFMRAQIRMSFKLKKNACDDFHKAFTYGKKEAYDLIVKECNE